MRILTFDVEDWYHLLDNASTRTPTQWAAFEPRIERNVERILEALSRRSQKATFFCLGWIARRHPDVIKAIHAKQHEIATHSDLHQLVFEQRAFDMKEDLRRSIDTLEQLTGQKVRAYRAPGFSIKTESTWAFEILVEAGIEIDCSVFPAPRAHGGLPGWHIERPAVLKTPSGPLKVFPMSMGRLLGLRIAYSGGGYFRLFPGSVVETLVARSDYVMTYFHPRDFDPDQPIPEGLSAARRVRTRIGLAGAMDKLERLIERFKFIDLQQAEADVDWSTALHFTLNGDGRLSGDLHDGTSCTSCS
jgi:polysaccharide deacetylase family protein (PEP-CTERM system associated)